MKHTPGPWKVIEDKNLIRVGLNETLTFGCFSINEIGRANAKLIAASPMLFEACKQALETMRNYIHNYQAQETFELLEQAISKAEGRE